MDSSQLHSQVPLKPVAPVTRTRLPCQNAGLGEFAGIDTETSNIFAIETLQFNL